MAAAVLDLPPRYRVRREGRAGVGPLRRVFEGKRLRPNEYVISADEKSQLQALGRRHETSPPGPGRPSRYEFEYERGGTLAYLAAWDLHHANLFDRVEPKTGIEPFGRLVEQVMTTEPYASAARSTGSSTTAPHTRARRRSTGPRPLAERPADPPPGARVVAEPDRAVLLDRATQSADPERPRHPRQLAERLLSFGERYRQTARPFEWTFTRQDLNDLIARIERHEPQPR